MAALSTIYLGAPRSYEAGLRRSIRADLVRLHTIGQRIAWGVMLADRLAVDLDAQVAVLQRNFGNEPVAHLLVAIVHRHKRRDAEAEAALRRARELVTDDHPWARLVPDAERWRCVPPKPQLLEVEPGRVYRVIGESRPPHAEPFGNRGVATFIRLRSGALVCINPVAMDDAVTAQVRALGEVTHIVSPAKYHNHYLADARQRFPGAQLWGVPGQRGYPQTAGLTFDGFLDDDAPLFPGEIDQVTMHGLDVGDVFFLDRASRTLLVTDAFMVRGTSQEFSGYRTFFADLYGWAWGGREGVTMPGYQPLMWKDLRAYQASLRRALALDFDHVASSHGPWHAIAGDARAVLARELGWFLDLGKLGALGIVLAMAKRHPGVFVRFVQLAREQKKALARRS